jgi:hypothetical protein
MDDGRFVRLDTRDANPGHRFCGDGLTLSHFAAHGKREGGDHAMFVRVHICVGMWAKDAALLAIAQGLGV